MNLPLQITNWMIQAHHKTTFYQNKYEYVCTCFKVQWNFEKFGLKRSSPSNSWLKFKNITHIKTGSWIKKFYFITFNLIKKRCLRKFHISNQKYKAYLPHFMYLQKESKMNIKYFPPIKWFMGKLSLFFCILFISYKMFETQ